jgi:hypothetical protein
MRGSGGREVLTDLPWRFCGISRTKHRPTTSGFAPPATAPSPSAVETVACSSRSRTAASKMKAGWSGWLQQACETWLPIDDVAPYRSRDRAASDVVEPGGRRELSPALSVSFSFYFLWSISVWANAFFCVSSLGPLYILSCFFYERYHKFFQLL